MTKKLKTILLTLLIMLMIIAFLGLCKLTNGVLLVVSLGIMAIILFTAACYLIASVIVDTIEEINKQ